MEKKTSGIRLEDLGKQLLANAEPVHKEVVKNHLLAFFTTQKQEYYLLFSKELGYNQVFKVAPQATPEDITKWVWGFMKDSAVVVDEEAVSMTDVREIQNGLNDTLEMWVGTTYFMLTGFDWGVEEVE